MQGLVNRDTLFMQQAISLAKKGYGKVSPNPLVGCVIVKKGKVVSKGHHKCFGLAHAEVDAIQRAKSSLAGASLYVNLEPCAHYGKTPPCVESIIKSNIKRVFVAIKDPNPTTNGKGIKILRKAGITVNVGLCKEEAFELNRHFFKYVAKGMPYVTLKMAQSLDGKIATRTGESKWITSESSRKYVHNLRASSDAIIVGLNTLNKDDPLLTFRGPQVKMNNRCCQPVKVIVDSKLRSSVNAKVFSKSSPAKTIVATTEYAPKKKIDEFARRGIEVLVVNGKKRDVSLRALFKILSSKGIINILAEGGGELSASLINERLVDRLLFFVAPKIVGGRDAKTSVEGVGISSMRNSINVNRLEVLSIGDDFLFEGYL